MIVLDTNVISEIHARANSERIVAWLNQFQIESLFITTISIGEMYYGLHLLDEGRRKASLLSAFARIEAEFSGRVIGFSMEAARRYGALSAARRAVGRSMETKDAMIAAICLTHGATLATRNTKDFEGLDLKLVNPFEDG